MEESTEQMIDLTQEENQTSSLQINLISIDPGWNNMAYVKTTIVIDFKPWKSRMTFMKLKAKTVDLGINHKSSVYELTSAIHHFVENDLFSEMNVEDLEKTFIIIEDGFFNYQNIHQNQLSKLQTVLYTWIVARYKTKVEFVRANVVKKFFLMPKGTHRENKLEALKVALDWCSAKFPSSDDIKKFLNIVFGEIETHRIIQSAHLNNHVSDALLQLFYFLDHRIISSMCQPDVASNLFWVMPY